VLSKLQFEAFLPFCYMNSKTMSTPPLLLFSNKSTVSLILYSDIIILNSRQYSLISFSSCDNV
jgi:hypothetical protein